jgi:hypothetical protein
MLSRSAWPRRWPLGQLISCPGGQDDVLHTNAGANWPLIQRVLADEVYAARYRELLAPAGLASANSPNVSGVDRNEEQRRVANR